MTDRVIWKWPMKEPVMELTLVDDAKVIAVDTQHGVPTLWTMGSQSGIGRRRTFVMKMTGEPFSPDEKLTYLGTAHDVLDWMVVHIFERED